jgi:UrcA family protein
MLTLMTALLLVAAPQAEHRIAVADLDLSSGAGRAALSQRIARTIDRVCTTGHQGLIAMRAEQAHCRRRLAAQIEPQRAAAIARHSDPQVAAAD